MRIGVCLESDPHETRVALIPESVKRLSGKGHSVVVQAGAGARALHADDAYRQAGAEIVDGPDALVRGSDLLCCVGVPGDAVIGGLGPGKLLLGLLAPSSNTELLSKIAGSGASAIAFETVPRITRAQKVDALSAMSTVAGYRAVILAAEASPKMFPMLMTAAGTVTAAKALIIGAGVAGLQAIATARRLGAVVEAYDIRPAAKEQVLSLGAKFVELPGAGGGDAETAGGYAREQSAEEQAKQRQLMADHVAASDIVITTALVPGKPAPKLIDRATVERMRPGSVIVDLAAEAGGNCELTQPGESAEHQGVTILGPANLPAQCAVHASQMFSRVCEAFVPELAPESALAIDLNNDIVGPALVAHAGEVRYAPAREALGLGPLPAPEPEPEAEAGSAPSTPGEATA
ncbi:MAG: Re/Si-specific NAD(P)(+) transhydrogenase subunit alpha [Phycisphaeraceae bacterium]|nr:Re/Si-specific NAD(P)(+) transhydrogenase subunit alpha [Phycisphaeraceae bacterium]